MSLIARERLNFYIITQVKPGHRTVQVKIVINSYLRTELQKCVKIFLKSCLVNNALRVLLRVCPISRITGFSYLSVRSSVRSRMSF